MNLPAPTEVSTGIRTLLRADPAELARRVDSASWRQVWLCVGLIVAGPGVYGAVMGAWREPLQALYTGLKLPLAILLTTLGNALLNGMLAPLLGLNVNLRQSLVAVLMTFAIAGTVLGSLAPVAAFVVWNIPPLSAATQLSSVEHSLLQLALVGFIAGSGLIGNLVFLPTLHRQTGRRRAAGGVLLAWLSVNLLLGSQVCWLLRPFIWDPMRPVEFLGPEYFRGSFYETVFEAARKLLTA